MWQPVLETNLTNFFQEKFLELNPVKNFDDTKVVFNLTFFHKHGII